jgi:hypothetical protein
MRLRYAARDGLVIVGLEDATGAPHELALNTMEAAELIGALRASMEQAIGHPAACNIALPGMVRVQYVKTETEVFFRHRVKCPSEQDNHGKPSSRSALSTQ